jgi:hypothetical protein
MPTPRRSVWSRDVWGSVPAESIMKLLDAGREIDALAI